jgi:hypothetical protein
VLGTQCGGTRWAQCGSTIMVGAQSICGKHNQFMWGHGMPCPHIDCIDSCHLLPFHAILCHPMPSHALPYHAAATMLPCHDLTPMPCPYHAMTRPHALPLPSHATAAICCHLLPPMPSHALPHHAAATMHHTPTMPHNTTMLPCHDPPHVLPPNSGNPHDGGSTVVEAQSRA